MSRISNGVEAILFRSRFLLAPLYLGLVGALALLAYRFVIEFWHLAEKTADMNAAEFTLALLALLDLTLLANLILMVILLVMKTSFHESILQRNLRIVLTGWEPLISAV
jgi:uncharacterized protein (TIGR00645 family)